MTEDPRIGDLLLDWEQASREGRPLSPEDLCRDCPALLEPLRRRIRLLTAMDTALDLSAYQDSPAGRPAVPPAPPAITVPGYEILEEVGRGGMGVVYKARQIGLDRIVALKMILAGRDAGPAERARFEAEAKAAAKLSHPQIVHIYEIGEQGGCPYFTMEFLAGGSLEDALQGRPLPARQAAAVVEGLARAAHYAHRQGIIHRDLKPGNVLLGAKGQGPGAREEAAIPSSLAPVKIADFGLARHLGAARQTRPGSAVGTPAFMAPEQASGEDADVGPRADVYSLGALLYQLLTGRAPFEGKSDWQIIDQVLHRPPTPPRECQPDTPPELEAVCLRCLEKAPDRRYSTAEALAEDLRRYLDGAPLVPPPPTVVLSGSRPTDGPLRFGRRVALAGAVLLTALLVPGILFLLRPPQPAPAERETIRLGILRPTAGPFLNEGAAMVEAALLAIDELNARGGPLGRRVQEVLLDTGTERDRIPDATWKQLDEQRGLVLLGCLNAQTRETLRLILNARDSLLIYPGPADGVLPSEYVVSLRPTPPQSVLPVVDLLCQEQGKKRLFLVGSDSLYPRAVFEMLRQYLKDKLPDVEVVGEAYLPESEPRTRKIVDAIRKEEPEPDAILNLLHDAATLDLFKEVFGADFHPPNTPVVTLRFGDTLLRNLRDAQSRATGQYLVGNYFSDLPGKANEHFKKQLHIKYRDSHPADDTAVAAYVGVHLWAKAVEKAGSAEPAAVRKAIRGLSFDGPAGPVRIDPATGYSHSIVRLALVEKGGTLHVTHEWAEPRDPAPFFGHPPESKYWQFLLDYWHRNWSGRAGPRWYNPGDKRILPPIPDEAGGFAR